MQSVCQQGYTVYTVRVARQALQWKANGLVKETLNKHHLKGCSPVEDILGVFWNNVFPVGR